MSREALLAAIDKAVEEDTRLESVDVPGMGTFYRRIVSVAEIEEYRAADEAGRDEAARLAQQHPWAASAARLLCDENGDRLYDAKNPDHIRTLSRLGFERLMKMLGEGESGNSPGAKS